MVLGVLAAGVAGVVAGGRLRVVSRLLPGGDSFRIYSVAGFLPTISTAEYRLRVHGKVARPLELTFDEVTSLGGSRVVADFQCVTGWRVDDVTWDGVRLSLVLDAAGADRDAGGVMFRSADGVYDESLTMDQARRDDVLVAYSMAGDEPITSRHGGPVRLFVAPMYGYKSLKWLTEIEVVDQPAPGYWERDGYDADAWVGRSNDRGDAPTT